MNFIGRYFHKIINAYRKKKVEKENDKWLEYLSEGSNRRRKKQSETDPPKDGKHHSFIEGVLIAVTAGIILGCLGFIATYVISYFKNTDIDDLKVKIETKAKDIQNKFHPEVIIEDEKLFESDSIIKDICKFQSKVISAVELRTVHDNIDFEGNSIIESCAIVKSNLASRTNYDNIVDSALKYIRAIHDYGVKKEIEDYTLDDAYEELIYTSFYLWLSEDKGRNDHVNETILQIENNPQNRKRIKSSEFNKAIDPLIEYKKDASNYKTQFNLFDFFWNKNSDYDRAIRERQISHRKS